MAVRWRFWTNARWRKAWLPDSGMAEAEGLAAGTGLLTGEVARTTPVADVACPACHRPSVVVVIDLVAHETSRACPSCGNRWTSAERVAVDRPRR
jgi:hypothetical protein